MQPFLGADPRHAALFPDPSPPCLFSGVWWVGGGFLFYPQSGQEAGAFGFPASQPPPESLSLRKSAFPHLNARKVLK